MNPGYGPDFGRGREGWQYVIFSLLKVYPVIIFIALSRQNLGRHRIRGHETPMGIRLIAKDLYQLIREVERLEKQIDHTPYEKHAGNMKEQASRKLRAERNHMRKVLEGCKDSEIRKMRHHETYLFKKFIFVLLASILSLLVRPFCFDRVGPRRISHHLSQIRRSGKLPGMSRGTVKDFVSGHAISIQVNNRNFDVRTRRPANRKELVVVYEKQGRTKWNCTFKKGTGSWFPGPEGGYRPLASRRRHNWKSSGPFTVQTESTGS